MYIKALELQHYEKDVYLSVRLLEVMDDDQLYKKSELAEMLKLDVRSVQRLLTELSKQYHRFNRNRIATI